VIWLLLACGVGNTPPRFETVNGQEVKHLFGFNFLLQPLTAFTGERLDIELGITDRQRDRFRLLWPQQPPGWSWNEEETRGYWIPPTDWWQNGTSLSVVAIDTHGASEVLYLDIEVPDAVKWDTGRDSGKDSGDEKPWGP
jgi:hypothetical protein